MKRLLLVMLVAACGSGSQGQPATTPIANATPAPAPADPPPPAPAPSGIDATVAKMAAFRDQMCACKDVTCANAAQGEMNTWAEEMSKRGDIQAQKPTEEQMRTMSLIGTDIGECMAKLYQANPAPPAATP